ncbi:uncharacterized protein B0I36DRAFT_234959 [Microdochium trichocladiopsis]|uniref:Uncharacterized protein n=1 Tax=Microdochium trichocladiopsis TaxID=1682393 RepID=A0A9P9BW99_9PEZI|nr:uncharacterized protein B0I36DRAFT_234959 [Microdochium trichocladiopsis]KAH7040587.1 hypothetical protein B0I36DRAFT_234959 [Microdochium trichocladiopsis]
MLSRRLGLLTITLSFIIIVFYTLSGTRTHVVLIPTTGDEADQRLNQPGAPGSNPAAAAGHHGGGASEGHQHLHNAGSAAQSPAGDKTPAKEAAAAALGTAKPQQGFNPGPPPSKPPVPPAAAAADESKWGHTAGSAGSPKVEFVVSSTKATNTSWVAEFFPSVPAHIYIADDPTAPYTVRKNIGHESSVYLTYIIDHYDDLPDIVVFLHGKRYQWHNEDPLYDGVRPLQKLRIPYVQDHGFATLRCSWLLGCPLEIKPDPAATLKWDDPDADQRAKTEAAYAAAFRELFPGKPLPEAVGVHCGAQFAVTRERIRANSRADYVSYRDWLWTTELTDEFSGRVMEYSWHQILGAPAVDCPDAGVCFCEKFGMCDLYECHDYGCEKTYFFKFGELPDGWPEVGSGTDGWPLREWADPGFVPPPPAEKSPDAAAAEKAGG